MTEKKTNPFYRSLAEREGSEALRGASQNEFAEKLTVWSRRDFLKAMGFGTAAAAVAACSPMPAEKAIPYLIAPEQIVPGKATWYASTCGACPAQCGILAKTREGRPIKLEGNPDSPLNRGGLCAVGQSGVLDLYDSGRLHGPWMDGKASTWGGLDARMAEILADSGNVRIRILSSTITSPTLRDLLQRFGKKFPHTKHVTYDAVSVSGILDAHREAFGARLLPHYRFDKAEVIVSFGADFLGTWISPVEFTKQYRQRRTPGRDTPMSRHIQFESRLSLTGANADERVPMRPSEERAKVTALYTAITGTGKDGGLAALASELKARRGRSLVISGSNDPEIQRAVIAINDALGNYGVTLEIDAPSLQKQGSDNDLQVLQTELASGAVDVLILYGCNPVYDLADGAAFTTAAQKCKTVVSLSPRLDETASIAQIIAPDHHYLEAWNDAEPVAGLYHLAQPVIAPIYSTRHAGESLLAWMGTPGTFEAQMRSRWPEWRKSLHDGAVKGRASSNSRPGRAKAFTPAALAEPASPASLEGFELEVFEPVMLRDGRNANNPWLQETPDPLTKVTWGNVALLSVADGKRLGIVDGDIVRLKSTDAMIELPALLQPGQTPATLSVALGYGRTRAGKVGDRVGANAFPFAAVRQVSLTKTGRHEALALTQIHYSLEDRPLVRDVTHAEFQKPGYSASGHADLVMLWEEHKSEGNSWGLAIDLSACTGCSGCLVSCQAENNVAVVGKDEVRRQREMHWIRIDRYYKGDLENPEVVFEPMLCQHCGNAPCESVCPVLATVHSSDGLNQQVYNRCVGTRYCANNCPYKVRRFNWFDYANNSKFDFHMNDDTGKLVLNPDVTVRSRGVMEKCSLCVQRIQEEKIKARASGGKLNPDNIMTACQQSCPSEAIVFGDRNDPESRLSKLVHKNPRAFHVLEELNVKPAITYLAKVRNRG